MTYQSTADLPETLRTTLPKEAQTVYLNAYNEAVKGELPTAGGDMPSESAAHAVAWQAMEQEFERNPNDGKWYRQGEGPTADEASGGLIDKIKAMF